DEPDNGQAPKQSDPFFMFVHLWDVHFDFVPPPPYDTMFDPDYAGDLTGENFFRSPRINPQMSGADLRHILALYDGEIAWTDHHIGKILDDLDARGLLANTIVALVSDHGEEFFEHGKKGHRFTLYDEVIRIPMILWYPEKIRSGVRIQSPSSLIDIFPTLLELAGAPKADKVMGRSLLPAINGGSAFEDRLAISELNTLGRNLATFRGEATKLLLNNDNGHAWTFDLRLDRNESLGQRVGRQLAKWEVPLIEQSTQLKLWLDESKTQWPIATTAPQLSEELAEQLKVLGYLDDDEPKSSGTAAEPKGQP
ncbi:MAG: membrane-anchored protein YejM (alkaline phosphatase superfamily), partial [Myxococcota bacterium]